MSDDSTPSCQAKTEETASLFQCRYITGLKRGLYVNRNYSALACSGTHVRTMDDDHRLPANHLEKCLAAIEQDPDSIWTTGERGFVEGQYYMTLETASQLHPSGVGEAVGNLDDNWAIADGSTIYPADIFRRGHRLVEWYGMGSSYLEFGAYLYRHGYKSRCIRGAQVDHYAQAATLSRINGDNRQYESIESQLFASLCFNLYFQPDNLLALKYFLSCLKQSKFNPLLIKRLPLILSRVKQRWRA